MAEVRKKKVKEEYNIDKISGDDKKKKANKSKSNKNEVTKNPRSKDKKVETKKSFLVRFRIFCHGVKSEFNKVHWTTKDKMVKYSIMVVVFIIAMSLFFYLIDVVFAFIQSLFN